TLSLKRVDESLSDMFGDLSAQLNNLQDTVTSALSTLSLKRVDESLSDMFGDLSAQLNNLQDTVTSA
ncbi:hypothetical protein QTL91_24650, partial [Salmonella enterica subsp. enterica serovar Typhimurium]|nr:hypothetical protein [Salmonella enterica subsp. enterica serovar Typhimurium]